MAIPKFDSSIPKFVPPPKTTPAPAPKPNQGFSSNNPLLNRGDSNVNIGGGSSNSGKSNNQGKTTRGGGGGGSGVVNDPSKQSSVSQVQAVATQEKINQGIDVNKNILNQNDAFSKLGIANQQQSRMSDVFDPRTIANNNIEKLQSQSKSIRSATQQQIDSARSSGAVDVGTALLAQQAYSRKLLQDNYNTRVDILKGEIKQTVEQGYNQEVAQLEQEAQNSANYWQGQVNNGLSVDEAKKKYQSELDNINKKNKEIADKWNKYGNDKFKEFNNNYFSNVAPELQKSEQLRIQRKYVEYAYNQNKKDIPKEFAIGAGVGALVTVGTKAIGKVAGEKLSAPITFGLLGARDISKGNISGGLSNFGIAGLGLIKKGQYAGSAPFIIGGTAINLLKPTKSNPVYQGYKTYSLFRDLGATKGESVREAYSIGAGEFIKSEAGLLGAVAGGSAVEYGFNKFSGKLNINEQKLLKEALSVNPNIIKLVPQKGYVMEKDIYVKNANTGEISQFKSGTIVRQEKAVIDTSGQRKEVIQLLNKLSVKGSNDIITAIDAQGNVVQLSNSQITNLKLKRAIFSTNKKTSITSATVGKVNENSFFGSRVVRVSDVIKDKTLGIIKPKVPDKTVLKEERFSTVRAVGNVKYAQKGDRIFRAEESTSIENINRRDIYQKGIWTRSDINPKQSIGKAGYLSELKMIAREPAVKSGDSLIGKSTKTYKDIFGKSTARNRDSLFVVDKSAPTKAGKPFSPEPTVGKSLPEQTKPVETTQNGKASLISLPKNIQKEQTKSILVSDNTARDIINAQVSSLSEASTQRTTTRPLFREVKTEKPVSMLKTITAQSSMFAQPETDRLKTIKGGTIFMPTFSNRNSQVQVEGLFTAQKTNQAQRTQQQLQQSLFTPRPTTLSLVNNPQTFTPFFGLPTMDSSPTGGGERARPTRTSLFGKTKYNASIGSVLLRQSPKKVTASQLESLNRQKFSGLELRPEVVLFNPKRSK